MKKLLLILVLLLSFGYSQKAMAYSFAAVNDNGDTIYYNLISDSTVAVTYEGYYDNRLFYHGKCYTSEHIVIPQTVTYNEKTYTATTIRNFAFFYSRMLTITLPPTITSIEEQAFLDCHKLYSINFAPNSTTEMKIAGRTFDHCRKLEYINFPDYVTSIGNDAFIYTGLKTVILGRSISYIGDFAFPSPLAICHSLIPPVAGLYSLGNPSTKIIVPCESVEAYRSAPNLDIYNYSTCIGLEDISKENIDFTVYPNPAKDNITISTKQLEGGILSLYDIMGKEILRRRINNDETILDINRLKAGVYILKF